jgi:hypothetical protein
VEGLRRDNERLRASLRKARPGRSSPPEPVRIGDDWREAPFLVANFELEPAASLSWYLSQDVYNEIDDAAKNLRGTTIHRILQWVPRGDEAGKVEPRN